MTDEVKYALIAGSLIVILASAIAVPIIYYDKMMVDAGFQYVPQINSHWEKK